MRLIIGASQALTTKCLEEAAKQGVHFVETSPQYLGDRAVRKCSRDLGLTVMVKIPPMISHRTQPWLPSTLSFHDVYPEEYLHKQADILLTRYGKRAALFLHVWRDEWLSEARNCLAVREHIAGVSAPTHMTHYAQRAAVSGLFSTVQYQYNLFDQARLADDRGVYHVLRSPFAQGVFAGDSLDVADDWRRAYFDKYPATRARVDKVRAFADAHGITLKALALRFALSHPSGYVLVGVSKRKHVAELARLASVGGFDNEMLAKLRQFHWRRS